ncbi:MAG TPA: tetratricopeptide repeat protein [Thermoanaerobaculia bacterium]|jgi:tetratricopeptide (TPR) repeat protein/predicted phosphodiesterase|nr:tetratricopeptide repeat protein [Thermoanaerobaculia bacterium]
MPESTLTLLHVSDLHDRGPRERESWRRRRVLGDAWERNLDEIRADGPLDLVCFTGDAAFSGKADEYERVTEFFQALLERLGLGWDRFFLVPGNHDIDRAIEKPAWKKLREKLPQGKPPEVASWLCGGKAPLGFREREKAQVVARQAAYREWVRTALDRPELDPAKSAHGFLGYRQTLRLPGHPFDIHILGLDSAWMCGDDNDARRLWVTDEQVMRLATEASGNALEGFRLCLVHHPLDELADDGEVRRLLAERADLLLRGHLHDPEPQTWQDPERSLAQVAAGCLYENDTYPNACEVVRVTLNEVGRPLGYDLWFRGWSKRGHWFSDNSLYKKTVDGRLRWRHERPAAASADPRVARLFVGRKPELEALRESLLGEGGTRQVAICAVQGMPGVGKSYLAERFIYLYGDRFRGGVHRLVLDAEGGTAHTPESLLGDLADRLRLSTAPGGLGERVAERLRFPASLLYVENVDSAGLAGAVGGMVNRLSGCTVLATGRFQGLGVSSAWLRIPLQPFNEHTALAQLMEEMGEEGGREGEESYRRLVRSLGFLPLAVHLAAGHLRAGRSVDGFLNRLRGSGWSLDPADPGDLPLTREKTRALLGSTFALSLDLLGDALGGDRAALLAAFFDFGQAPASGFGTSLGAALAGLPPGVFEHLAVTACQLSLLEPVPKTQRKDSAFRIHPLLAEFLQAWSGEEAQRRVLERMTEWFVSRLPKLANEQQEEQRKWWSEIHAESAALTAWLKLVPEEAAIRVENAAAMFAVVNGPFHAWKAFCEHLLRRPLNQLQRSNAMWTLVGVSARSGDLNYAEAVARRKIELDRVHGEREAAIAASLLADVLYARGELEEALRIWREELPVLERLGDVQERALTMSKIATVFHERGVLEETLRILREEVLPVFERLGDVRERALTMGEIAAVLEERGEWEKALRILREEVLPIYERLGEVRSRAVTMDKIAGILEERGELEEALRIWREEVLPVYESLGDVQSQAVTMGKIAGILQERGELDKALHRWREEELPLYERFGAVQPRAVTMGKTAEVLQLRGELEEALRIWREEELPVYERFGDVRSRAATMNKIANVLQTRGELEEALRIWREEVLPVYERLGAGPSRAATMSRIADVLRIRGELEEALRILREEVLPVYERLGAEPSRAATMSRIADVLQMRGELEEALRIWREEVLPVDAGLGAVRSRAATMDSIAGVLRIRGELEEALRIWREEVLPVYERLGDVRARAVTMSRIGDVLQESGDLEKALRIRIEEQLPVFERFGDVYSRAKTRGKIADVYEARGELEEALRIRREEELPVYERLGDVRARAKTMGKIADVFEARSEPEEALRIRHEEELPVYERCGLLLDLLLGRKN